MFKIFNAVKNKVNSSVTAQSNDMGSISQAKENTRERDENRHKQSEILYNEALELIEEFKITNDDFDLLQLAAEKMEESLQYNRNRGEGYFWLSYIFYIFEDYESAEQYLTTAENLAPEYPQIRQLKSFISGNRSN
jgi:tetratricopeptide (TPR) repeat protein